VNYISEIARLNQHSDPMPTRYAEVYRQICLNIQTTIEHRIGRPLSEDEKLGIWNAGSLTMLESVDHELAHASSILNLPRILQHNANVFHNRFTTALEQAQSLITSRRLFALIHGHRKMLEEAQTIYDILKVTEQYSNRAERQA